MRDLRPSIPRPARDLLARRSVNRASANIAAPSGPPPRARRLRLRRESPRPVHSPRNPPPPPRAPSDDAAGENKHKLQRSAFRWSPWASRASISESLAFSALSASARPARRRRRRRPRRSTNAPAARRAISRRRRVAPPPPVVRGPRARVPPTVNGGAAAGGAAAGLSLGGRLLERDARLRARRRAPPLARRASPLGASRPRARRAIGLLLRGARLGGGGLQSLTPLAASSERRATAAACSAATRSASEKLGAKTRRLLLGAGGGPVLSASPPCLDSTASRSLDASASAASRAACSVDTSAASPWFCSSTMRERSSTSCRRASASADDTSTLCSRARTDASSPSSSRTRFDSSRRRWFPSSPPHPANPPGARASRTQGRLRRREFALRRALRARSSSALSACAAAS